MLHPKTGILEPNHGATKKCVIFACSVCAARFCVHVCHWCVHALLCRHGCVHPQPTALSTAVLQHTDSYFAMHTHHMCCWPVVASAQGHTDVRATSEAQLFRRTVGSEAHDTLHMRSIQGEAH
eukprot:15449978-Alexandrium_andersonii.AAC.1